MREDRIIYPFGNKIFEILLKIIKIVKNLLWKISQAEWIFWKIDILIIFLFLKIVLKDLIIILSRLL